MKQNDFDITHLQRAVQKKMNDLPAKMANMAERHFKQSFRDKGFTDRRLEKWKETKYPNHRGSLMQRSGKLRRSIRKGKVTPRSYTIIAGGSHVPYAGIHNEGGTVRPTVTPRMRGYFRYKYKQTGNTYYKNMANTKKKHFTVQIPQRKFMGRSYVLNQNTKRLIINEIKRL